MKRALTVVFVLAAFVVAFHVGTLRGIDLGVEETLKLRPVVIPVPCPTPTLPEHRS